jgi:TolB-like protein/Flp pilus assembly protein TadD
LANSLPAYQGDQPYSFVCYAHEDSAVVFEEIRWLQDQGCLLWHDGGISTGVRWSDDLAQHILNAKAVLFFVSPRSALSENCLDEINLALDNGKPVVAVHLEKTQLPPGAALRLAHRQAIHRYEIDEKQYRDKLSAAMELSSSTGLEEYPRAKRRSWVAPSAALVVIALIVGAYFLWPTGQPQDPVTASAARQTLLNSIAVLPFENMSPDPDNAYFAAGIHDDLLTQLAKIGSLKVISRTSVLVYRDSPKNMREIGRELGVATILEGGVRRAGDTVRINVQLIDAQTDKNLWAETYDRQLTAQNVFAIQSEMATSIAGALQATLSPQEVARLNEVPTQSTRAYDFYLIGNDYFRRPNDPTSLPLALQMYERAGEEDPEFAPAFAALSHAHSRFYWIGLDRTDSRLELAAEALHRAFDLAPDLPEAHLAAGEYYYRGFRDYDRALEEYLIAERGMPGSAELAVARAEIYRRLGQWDHALANCEQAIDLDPRNPLVFFQHAYTSVSLRDYAQAELYVNRALEIGPDAPNAASLKANIPLYRDGDHPTLLIEGRFWSWLAAIYKRDYGAELEYLDHWEIEIHSGSFYIPKASLYGVTYQLAGQPELAEPHFQAARAQVEEALAANAEDPSHYIALGEVLAGLGEQESAVRAARQAIALRPTSIDAVDGPNIQLDGIIRVFMPAGDYDAAIEELDAYLAGPGMWSIEGLLPDPRLDPIRDDPRFQALVEKYKRQ